MKRNLITTITYAFVFLGTVLAPFRTRAALDLSPVSGRAGNQIVTSGTAIDVAFNVLSWVLAATGAFTVLMIIIGGFRYVSSAGNEDQAEAAKETITKAVTGLVIVLLAYVIAATINGILGGGSSGGSGSGGGCSFFICISL